MKHYNDNELEEMKATESASPFIEGIDLIIGEAREGVQLPEGIVIDEDDGKMHLRVCNAEKGVHIDDKLYYPLPYQRDDIQEERGSDNAVVTSITVGDPESIIFDFCEPMNFFTGCSCRLIFAVQKEEEAVSEYEYDFFVSSVSTNLYTLTFNLATSAPWLNQFPPRRMYRAKCQFVFKSAQCGYVGEDMTCARTIDACRAKNNQSRIGCFPGCGMDGLHK